MNIFEIYGGKEFLKNKYPEVYKALVNAREITPEEWKKIKIPNPQVLHDDVAIRSIFFKNNKVGASLSANFIKHQSDKTRKPRVLPLLSIYSIIKNEKGEEYSSKIDSIFNTNSLSSIYLSEKEFPKGETAKVRATFSYIDEDGVFYYTSDEREKDYIYSAEEIIDGEPKISDPKWKSGANETNVNYNRQGHYGRYGQPDYAYPNNVLIGNKYYKVLLPFVGSFKIKKEWEIEGIERGRYEPRLCLAYKNSGTLDYPIDKLVNEKIKIDKVNNEISWNLTYDPGMETGTDDWQVMLEKEEFGIDTIATFFGEFTLHLSKGEEHLMFTFSVKSDEKNQTLKDVEVLIKSIHFYIGCFAKDTMIGMADGTEKKIKDIQIGDKIQNGGMIHNIITGHEKELIRVETVDGSSILLTATHPLKTSEGFMRVQDLHIGQELIVNGNPSEIAFLYPEHYDDRVYNLILNDENPEIQANGFIAGDFLLENSLKEPTPEYLKNPEIVKLCEEFKKLCAELEQQKKK